MSATKPPLQFAATAWFKATASAAQNECVEVNTSVPAIVGVRDSKDLDAGVVAVRPSAFNDLIAAVRAGSL
ncbi:DUF397 domain-containing protein [Streptomyces sp. NPDC056944]|uniref:DUF397 domain-containing protein n=1 Tax=unclassified Streptomyces TaxID=2593676 RepID=UPI003634C1A2